VIIPMAKVRVLGPKPRLDHALTVLQDLGLVHLATLRTDGPLRLVGFSAREERRMRQLERLLEDIEVVLDRWPGRAASPTATVGPTPAGLARWAREARRARRTVDRLVESERWLEEEHALLIKYRRFFGAFQSLLEHEDRWPNARAHHVILRGPAQDVLARLRRELEAVIGREFEIASRPLGADEVAVLLLVPVKAAGPVERLLASAGVPELPVPQGYGGETLTAAMPSMRERLRVIPLELERVRRARAGVRGEAGARLAGARRATHDALLRLSARSGVGETAAAFVIEGWVPTQALPRVARRVADRLGETVVVERLATEDWAGEDAPVVLSNPRLFRPFEAITRMVPLPRYGSIDPTPFVSVFFPMFFGVMLGDIGYGAALALLALGLHLRSRPGTPLRAVSEIAGACALFTVVFGLLYGELLGDLGRQMFGLRPLAFDRQETIVPFLVFAVALGLVHVVVGLAIGAVEAFRGQPRASLGRGLTVIMVLVLAATLLAAAGVLPRRFFTPGLVALLVAFPVLVVLEGIVAPVEFMSTIANILSYTRIMALGTASVLMAVVANRMVGALGGAAVGVLFAVLFHLVNFALGLFGPTIHGLRLQYVEFFGKFYSPGGVQYRPFGHWQPSGQPAA